MLSEFSRDAQSCAHTVTHTLSLKLHYTLSVFVFVFVGGKPVRDLVVKLAKQSHNDNVKRCDSACTSVAVLTLI